MGSKERKRRKKNSRTVPVVRAMHPHDNRVAVLVICVALAAIVWITFGQTLNYQFVNYDDNEYVYDNPAVKNGLMPAGCVNRHS